LRFEIAIIGLGATGVALLKSLQDQVSACGLRTLRVAVFSPSRTFARGEAFGDAAPHHLVNTTPSMLALRERSPHDFAHWLARYGTSERFPPRRLFAAFLQDAYHSILNTGLLDIEPVREEVVSICRESNGYRISTAGQQFVARSVVLCLGLPGGTNFPELSDKPGFYQAYKHKTYDEDDAPVLIAGTGLTGVDEFRSANLRGRRRIYLFSRHGYAPTCLSPEPRHIPTELDWDRLLKRRDDTMRLDNFFGALHAECQRLPDGGEQITATKLLRERGLSAYFDHLLSRAAASDLPYQDILVSTRPYMHELWRALTLKDKLLFNTSFGAHWATWRHPAPCTVIEELREAAEEGRLQIHQAASRPGWDGQSFVLQTASGIMLRAPSFIDATGGPSQIYAIASPLLHQLCNEGLIESHPCGGIKIHPLSFECHVGGLPTPGLYSLGPLDKGVLFSTNAFWFNARCAEQWARHWANTEVHRDMMSV